MQITAHNTAGMLTVLQAIDTKKESKTACLAICNQYQTADFSQKYRLRRLALNLFVKSLYPNDNVKDFIDYLVDVFKKLNLLMGCENLKSNEKLAKLFNIMEAITFIGTYYVHDHKPLFNDILINWVKEQADAGHSLAAYHYAEYIRINITEFKEVHRLNEKAMLKWRDEAIFYYALAIDANDGNATRALQGLNDLHVCQPAQNENNMDTNDVSYRLSI